MKNQDYPKIFSWDRTVVDTGKPIVAVRVLNLSDDEQIVREGTDIANCDVIDNVTVVDKTEPGTHEAGIELPELVKELYDRGFWRFGRFAKRTSCILVHHLFNQKGSLVDTKSLVHCFKDGGL